RHFRTVARATPKPLSVAIGMAGMRTESDRERIRKAAGKVWPGVPCYATNDLETALVAGETRGMTNDQCPMTKVRSQREEGGGQGAEVRGQRAEGKFRISNLRFEISDFRGQISDFRGQRSEEGRSTFNLQPATCNSPPVQP